MSKAPKQEKVVLSAKRRRESRREFLRTTALAAGVMTASLFGYYPVAQGISFRLRPPGAIKTADDEQEFLASCIKCGQCVQVCPVEAIKLADIADGFAIGTPYIDPREQACDFSCDGLQCILACPTGALTHELDYPADSRMGFARIDKPSACLASQGKGFKGVVRGEQYEGKLRFDEIDRWNPIALNEHPYDLEICDLCVRQCPIEIRIAQCEAGKPPSNDPNQCPPKHAITLEPIEGTEGQQRMRPVIQAGCVGCGVCEMICPVEPTVIVIDIDKVTEAV